MALMTATARARTSASFDLAASTSWGNAAAPSFTRTFDAPSRTSISSASSSPIAFAARALSSSVTAVLFSSSTFTAKLKAEPSGIFQLKMASKTNPLGIVPRRGMKETGACSLRPPGRAVTASPRSSFVKVTPRSQSHFAGSKSGAAKSSKKSKTSFARRATFPP
jgi:hypothetical protein